MEPIVLLDDLCKQFSQLDDLCRRFSLLGMELRLFGFGFVVVVVQLATRVDRYQSVVQVEGIAMLGLISKGFQMVNSE